jgi:hypothetical protein
MTREWISRNKTLRLEIGHVADRRQRHAIRYSVWHEHTLQHRLITRSHIVEGRSINSAIWLPRSVDDGPARIALLRERDGTGLVMNVSWLPQSLIITGGVRRTPSVYCIVLARRLFACCPVSPSRGLACLLCCGKILNLERVV